MKLQATYEEFEAEFNKYYRFRKYFNVILMYLLLGFGVFCFIKLGLDYGNVPTETKWMFVLLGAYLVAFGVLGLVAHWRKYQLIKWENSLTKSQNIELINSLKARLTGTEQADSLSFLRFQLWRGWWKTPCYVFLFADENYVFFNIESMKGLIDFGADKKRQQMIIRLLTELSVSIK